MTIDHETVRRISTPPSTRWRPKSWPSAVRLCTPAPHRTYAKQDGGDAVITTASADGGVLRSEAVGVSLTDLT
jgi:hypothetical protein